MHEQVNQPIHVERHGIVGNRTPQPELRSVGELFLDVAEQLRAVFSEASASVGLSFVEGRALRLVAKRAQQNQLVDVLSADPSRVSALLRRLEKKGLIVRRPARDDKRRRTIELTERGERAHHTLMQYLVEHSPLMRLDRDRMELLRVMLVEFASPE